MTGRDADYIPTILNGVKNLKINNNEHSALRRYA